MELRVNEIALIQGEREIFISGWALADQVSITFKNGRAWSRTYKISFNDLWELLQKAVRENKEAGA